LKKKKEREKNLFSTNRFSFLLVYRPVNGESFCSLFVTVFVHSSEIFTYRDQTVRHGREGEKKEKKSGRERGKENRFLAFGVISEVCGRSGNRRKYA